MVQHPRQSVSAHYQHQRAAMGSPRPLPIRVEEKRSTTPRYAQPQPPLSKSSSSRHAVLAGGSVLAGSSVIAAVMWITPTVSPQPASQAVQEECIKIEQAQNFLSRDKLKKLLEVDAQAPKAAVREVLSEPHCVLEPRINESGVQVEREAYPLEFDPNTWLVVLYEGDQYAGYDFTFRQ